MLEDEYVKSLGNLDEDSKKIIWGTCISGSQIKKMFYNLRDVYFEKTTMAPEKIFSEKTEEKMAMGRELEPVIRKLANEKWNLNIEYTPDTYVLKANPFFTANIDGFRRTSEGLEIIEIKNTEEEDINKVYEYYKYQIQYYMWFFNAKSARLIALSNGWHLQQLEIEKNEELQHEIVERANALCKAIKDGDVTSDYFNKEEEIADKNTRVEYVKDDVAEKLNRLLDITDKIKELEEEEKLIETELKNAFAKENEKVIVATDLCNYSLTMVERKGIVDYKQYFTDNKIDETELEKYRKPTTTQIRGVLTKVK